MLKKVSKYISRTFAFGGLLFSLFMIKILPRKFLFGFAHLVAFLGYYIAAKHRKIALESLSIAFEEEKTPGEIKKIAKDCFLFMARNGLEMTHLIEHPDLLKKIAGFQGKEHLDAALAKGKGAILLTAHFGNFPLMMARISLEGYKLYGIMRRMRDQRVEKLFAKKRRKLNVNAIHAKPRSACVEESLRVLRNNELLCIQLDQNFGSGGVFVDFFGKKAATATGPVVLGLRAEAAIIPCFILHNSDNSYKIVFEPEYKLKTAQTQQEAVSVNIQAFTGIIEGYIRRYPAEWGWIHRRWKSRPAKKEE